MNRHLTMIAPLLLGIAGAGCQNTIHIRVERVLGVSSVARESQVGRQLDATVDTLTRIIDRCQKTQEDARAFQSQFPESAASNGAPTRASVGRQLESYDRALKEIAAGATVLRHECERYFKPGESGAGVPNPRLTLTRVRDFCEMTREDLQEWPQVLEGIPNLETLGADASRQAIVDSPKILTLEVEIAAAQTKRGFGGFVSTDVYVINPSDPQYAAILKSGSPVLAALRTPFSRSTSLETITEAKVSASGDSAAMLVMEHPGQIRVYQVSNDPAQLTRNIGMLVNKATGAAAKYLTAGATP